MTSIVIADKDLRIRSSENNIKLGKQPAYVRAPYFTVSNDGKMTWVEFKRSMYYTAIELGDYSVAERRRQKRALGRDDNGRVPLAIGEFGGQQYALMAVPDADFSYGKNVEVVSYSIPTRW